MKSKSNLLEQLNTLPHFTKGTVRQLGRQFSIGDATLDTDISRFLKNNDIYRLKNGLYVSSEFYNNNRGDISYMFYLANVIRTPSYVSSWAALQYHNLTTEATHSITSVTPKVTRDYHGRAGNFTYQSIDKKHFSDFILVRGNFDFFIARPAKALFDLLYFRTRQLRGFTSEKIELLSEELRIDIDEMDKDEREYFYSLIKKHLHE